MAKTVLRFRNMTIAKQPGELGRIRVVSGTDQGTVFVLLVSKVTIGRGEENDIVISDLKASRRHCEIILDQGMPTVRDIGSSHGLSVNGGITKQTFLKTGDRISIGESQLEYIGSETGSTKILTLHPTPKTFAKPAEAPTAATASGNFFEKNKKLVFMLGGLMALASLIPTVEQKQRAKKAAYSEPKEMEAERAIGSVGVSTIDETSKKSAEGFFKEGFREFRARNYLRARIAFETALQVNPGHALANIYLENTKKTMEGEGKEFIDKAKRDEEANRFDEALQKYDAVKRLYVREQTSELYKEASSRSDDLKKKIKDIKAEQQ